MSPNVHRADGKVENADVLDEQINACASAATWINAANVSRDIATFAGFSSGVTSIVLREVACFNATSGGTMRSRAVFSAITLADSDFCNCRTRQLVDRRVKRRN